MCLLGSGEIPVAGVEEHTDGMEMGNANERLIGWRNGALEWKR